MFSCPTFELDFDGLNTIATVTLSGEKIFGCDNFFLPQRVDVMSNLAPGQQNGLEILCKSAAKIGEEHENMYGKIFNNLRESSRMYVRKTQYQWGGDWGIAVTLNSCGASPEP